MTRITDEAVEAAQKAWTKAYWTEATPGKDDWMRAALEAALPYLQAQPVASREAIIAVLQTFSASVTRDSIAQGRIADHLLAAGVFHDPQA